MQTVMPPPLQYAGYYLHLGQFVEQYARLEFIVKLVLFRYTGVSHQTGLAVFSGDRINGISGYLRRLAEVGTIPNEKWLLLDPVLTHLVTINDKRNDIIHYGATILNTGDGYVTNALMALTNTRKKQFPISAFLLDDMTFDCSKIAYHLLIEHMGGSEAIFPQEARNALKASWRYKSPPPNQNKKSPGGKRAKHQPPQPS